LATTPAADALQGPASLPWSGLDPFADQTDPSAAPAGDSSGGDQADQAPADSSYTDSTVARESGGNPLAKNPRSSASGTYQFTKATWQSVGGAWGSDPTKAFGGLTPSAAEQKQRFDMLTSRNGNGLAAAGLAATNAALYAAHFLGLAGAIKVLTAPASASLAQLVGSAVMKANPQLQGFTVADFKSWIGARG
jgi:hypothetical protein